MKVSILIPLYNQEKYINQCLKSVVDQTYRNIEIIIIDDGSTDQSYLKASSFLNDKRVKIIRQENQGLGETRNRLIKASEGEFIFHLDSDDYISEDCIEKMVKLQKKENYDIIFSNFYLIGNSNKIIKNMKRHNFKNHESYVEFYLFGLGFKSVCNVLIRKSILIMNNIYIPNINYGEDWSVIYKIIYYSSKISHTNRNSYYYRKNMDSMTYNKISDIDILKNINDLLTIKKDYMFFLKTNNIMNQKKKSKKLFFDIEIKNSIYSILLRNNKSMIWYKKNLKKIDDLFKKSNLSINSNAFFFKKCFRKFILVIKKTLLILNNFKEKNEK